MVARVSKLLLIEALVYKVMASYLPHTQQYYQVPGQQYYQIANTPIPSTTNNYASYMPSMHQSAVTSTYIDNSPYPTASYSPLNSYKYPDPSPLSPIPAIPSPQPLKLTNTNSSPVKPNISATTTPGYDTNVLNNLAIALQLLIVSNLLNSPLPEKTSNIQTPTSETKTNENESTQAVNPVSTYYGSANPSVSHTHSSHLQPNEYQVYFDPNPYDQPLNSQSSLPNANYLGSSHNFGGLLGSFGVPPAHTRPGLNLKSPYDALASNTFNGNAPSAPFEYTKKDLQSPYAAIMAADNYKDLFSIDF